MHNDESFLRSIADNPADDSTRLLYAKWLEERGDSRANFLRVQHAFGKHLPKTSEYRDLCKKEQDLVRELDPSWVQRVRRYTTPEPCRNVAELVPELAPFATTTTRLHPHRAIRPLPTWMSKIGGRFLWPKSEPWPLCSVCNVDLAPVIQLQKKYVPNIEFPAGADLLQLFWCPDEEAHDCQPSAQVFLRKAASVTSPRLDGPDLSEFPRISDWQGFVPFECAVFPEQVIEFPLGDDLYSIAGEAEHSRIRQKLEKMDLGPTDDLVERFSSSHGPSNPQDLACYELGECPGTKVGGKLGFERNGLMFEHLVTFSTWEFDSASFRRWLAVEDQRLFATPGEPLTWTRLFQDSDFKPFQEVLGMQLGRTQSAHIYVCRKREPWRVISVVYD